MKTKGRQNWPPHQATKGTQTLRIAGFEFLFLFNAHFQSYVVPKHKPKSARTTWCSLSYNNNARPKKIKKNSFKVENVWGHVPRASWSRATGFSLGAPLQICPQLIQINWICVAVNVSAEISVGKLQLSVYRDPENKHGFLGGDNKIQ